MEYALIVMDSSPRLVEEVGKLIDQGWTPLGGVSAVLHPGPGGSFLGVLYLQAMTRIAAEKRKREAINEPA